MAGKYPSCFSSTGSTDFLLDPQFIYVCTISALNTVTEAFGKHSRNLAMSLHKHLHLVVFLQLCFADFAPSCTDFQDEKQDIFLLWPNNTHHRMSKLGLCRPGDS